MIKFIPFLLLLIGLGCDPTTSEPEIRREPLWPDIDLTLYENVPKLFEPALEARNWNNVNPAEPTDYWELRRDDTVIIAKSGEKCKTATNRETCVTEFDAIRSKETPLCSIAEGCHPYYIVANYGNIHRVSEILDWHTVPYPTGPTAHPIRYLYRSASLKDTKNFLGTIDSKEEAILLALSVGHYGSNTRKEDGAIREVDGEYELIVLTVDHPIPHNVEEEERLLIRFTPSGPAKYLRSQYPQR